MSGAGPQVGGGAAGFGLSAASVGAQHAARAQLWIAVFGFIGNYFYTHYFYCVLRARYTMPAWRLNDVPIAMYFATHFYFSTYHVLAGLALRKVTSSFEAGTTRTWRSRTGPISRLYPCRKSGSPPRSLSTAAAAPASACRARRAARRRIAPKKPRPPRRWLPSRVLKDQARTACYYK